MAGATTALLLVVGLVIGGGLAMRALIDRTFRATSATRTTLGISRTVLNLQLDEETGVRGYVATHEQLFLEPYEGALDRLPGLLAALHDQLAQEGLAPSLVAAASDAAVTNAAWTTTIALPLIGARPDPDPRSTELAGKLLIDRFRADVTRINNGLSERVQSDESSLSDAINRVNVFVAIAAVAIAVLGAVFLEVQRRSALREGEAEALRAAYVAEKRIADALQDAIAERPLPMLPTLRFSATYVPATEETKVGGDWYDALELPNNRVLFAIGDVTGHGLEAAVTMNRARQALISSALLENDPSAVLRRVNEELFRQNAPLVTAVAGYADAGTYEFVYSTAGHPPPLLIEPGRRPRMLECGSLPLGALAGIDYRLHRIQSVPGAILVLYTDGAVEHSRNVLEGEELLIAAAAGAAEQRVDDPASFIHQTIFAGRPVGDDVAILTIGFAPEASTGVRISADDAQSAFVGRVGRGVGAAPAAHRPAGDRRRAA